MEKSDEGRFLKKKIFGPKFGQKRGQNGPEMGFSPFFLTKNRRISLKLHMITKSDKIEQVVVVKVPRENIEAQFGPKFGQIRA